MNNLNEKTLDLLTATGLNWTVSKESLSTASGIVTESFGLIRKDTQTCLGVVGKVYEPFQNYQMAEILLEAADGLGHTIERGGMLQNGRKIYLQIGLPDAFIGKSDVKRWITGLNSHDSSRCIGFGSSNITVVCANTYAMAFGDLLKFRHTLSAKEAIEEAMKGMRVALNLEERQIADMIRMSDLPLSQGAFASVIKACFDLDVTQSGNDDKKAVALSRAIDKEIQLEGPTLWGLFNGITRYTNHVAPAKDRDSYLMVGAGYETNLLAFNTIMEWIDARTEKAPVLVGA